jgi:phosphoenolpyruvate synthase/pyruvate phosphate dikinase
MSRRAEPVGLGDLIKPSIAASIELCERPGLDYVSCSPSRVPGARLAAAYAAVADSTAT